MAQAQRDDSNVTTIIGVSSVDLTTPINIAVDPTTNEMLVKASSEPDGTALSNSQTSVDTTAGGTQIVAASAGRQGVILANHGTTTAYVGTGTLTTSNGFELKGGVDYSINNKHSITLSGSRGERGFSRGRFASYHEYSDPSLTDQWYNSRDVFEVSFDYYGINFDYMLKFDQLGHELLSSVYYRSSQGRNTSDMTEDTASIIEAGTLKPGDRLLPHRIMADELGVTIGTVAHGYKLAAEWGLLSGEVGRGSIIKHPDDIYPHIPIDLNGAYINLGILKPTPTTDLEL